MLTSLFRSWLGHRRAPKRPIGYKLDVLLLEDRVVPANLTWVGVANALWSAAGSWAPAQVPVNGDVLTFDGRAGVGSNLNSRMDLGGGVQYHNNRERSIC